MTETLKALIRDVPDYPKPGILFRDITPLLRDAAGLRGAVEALAAPFAESGVDLVAGVEARGFILGPAMALHLGAGFVPLRKEGKLPGAVERAAYELEYGTAVLEVGADAVAAGQRVLLFDDVLATGGTAKAAVELLETLGAEVIGLSFLIELTALGGRGQIGTRRIERLIDY